VTSFGGSQSRTLAKRSARKRCWGDTILSRDWVTIDGVSIGNRIYGKLTERNCKKLRKSHWVTHSRDHCNYSTQRGFSVFTNRCLVADLTANVLFPMGSRTAFGLSYQLLTSHNFNPQLTHPPTKLLVMDIYGPHRKHLLNYYLFSRCRANNVSTELLPSNGCCTVASLYSCCLEMGLRVTVLNVELAAIVLFRSNNVLQVLLLQMASRCCVW
jgi:hypothetical protein